MNADQFSKTLTKHRKCTQFGKGSTNKLQIGQLESRQISAKNEDFLKTNH
jgi:hypothetical protein